MESTCMFYSWICCRAKWNGSSSAMYIACENICFSSLFATGNVPRGGTSATQRLKFHTDDANQYLYNKSGSHGVPDINLSNFTCLMVDFGKMLCSSANELQQNSNASSRKDYIPQILTVLLEVLRVYIWPKTMLLQRRPISAWACPTAPPSAFFSAPFYLRSPQSSISRDWPDSGQILRHQYGISVAKSQTFLRANVPSGEERGETDVFAGYDA